MLNAFATVFLAIALSAPALAQPADTARQGRANPEPATEIARKAAVEGSEFMIVAAHPLASQAGYTILSRGGSAVDAAIAAQLVLNIVEPQSSGIGGGGFMLHYAAEDGALSSYDGRETAPRTATPEMFLKPDGTPMGFIEAITGGRSVGVPGLLAMLKLAHDKHGKLPWAELFEPAIGLAVNGAPVGERLSGILVRWRRFVEPYPDTGAQFYKEDGSPLAQGDILLYPGLADALQMIAEDGIDAFYRGPLTGPMVDRIRKAIADSDYPDYAGPDLEDFRAYQAVERDPVCGTVGAYRICGMGPPSSGGIAVNQILGMVEAHDGVEQRADSAEALHIFIEAQRRAFADRELYLGDPAFADPPVSGLIDPGYIAARADTIDPAVAGPEIADAGTPPGADPDRFAPDREPKSPGTTHLSVVDAEGNIVSLTTSIEVAFGSRLMANGYLLNNQLTDFAFVPERDGKPVANAPAAGKRPLSSMSPTIVFDAEDRPVLITGSPGGTSIIGFVSRSILAHLSWGLSLPDALDYPHTINTNDGPTEIEAGAPLDGMIDELEAMGHAVKPGRRLTSGLHAISIAPDGTLTGAADKRREGEALGR